MQHLITLNVFTFTKTEHNLINTIYQTEKYNSDADPE